MFFIWSWCHNKFKNVGVTSIIMNNIVIMNDTIANELFASLRFEKLHTLHWNHPLLNHLFTFKFSICLLTSSIRFYTVVNRSLWRRSHSYNDCLHWLTYVSLSLYIVPCPAIPDNAFPSASSFSSFYAFCKSSTSCFRSFVNWFYSACNNDIVL